MEGGYGGNFVDRLPERPAAALRRIRPAYTIADYSQIGDTALARLGNFLNGPIPMRIVVIQYGVNDAGSSYPYESPLRALVARVKSLGKTPIVTGLSRGAIANRDAYDDIARKVAKDTGTEFADWGAAAFDPAEMADPIHPGQLYSLRLVQQLAAALDRVAPECRP